VGTWHDPDLGRPIAAPLKRCAQLLGVELPTVRELAATVAPYLRADGTRIWNLMQLERQLILPTPGGRQALDDAGDRVAEIEQHWSQLVGPARFDDAGRALQELLDKLPGEQADP
jgi:hypothetical protein